MFKTPPWTVPVGLKQRVMLCRFDRTHRLRHKMIGEAPHLLDPEVLDSDPVPDGKQRGMYYIPSSQGRSPDSAAEFVDSIFEVPQLIWPQSLC